MRNVQVISASELLKTPATLTEAAGNPPVSGRESVSAGSLPGPFIECQLQLR